MSAQPSKNQRPRVQAVTKPGVLALDDRGSSRAADRTRGAIARRGATLTMSVDRGRTYLAPWWRFQAGLASCSSSICTVQKLGPPRRREEFDMRRGDHSLRRCSFGGRGRRNEHCQQSTTGTVFTVRFTTFVPIKSCSMGGTSLLRSRHWEMLIGTN